MWLFVGLGNPGKKYEKNRHNVGFMIVDAFQNSQNAADFRSKFNGAYAESVTVGSKIGLLKPQTYMNESGQSVGATAKFYKIPAERIVVFHDELDLAPGEIRVKKGGGNAGHNGLKSIQAHLGTPDFWRVRIGIGHPGDKARVSGYVLSDFAQADQVWLENILQKMPKALENIPENGVKAVEEFLKS